MEVNNITISDAGLNDWEPAMELAYKTFIKFEAPLYGKPGTDSFLNFISDERLFKMFELGLYKVAVAKDNGKIVGVASLRSGSHISLLFVDENYHKRGIGKNLLMYMQCNYLMDKKMAGNHENVKMTVNAAPYAVEFYKKLGFYETDKYLESEGITYLPMTCLNVI